MRIRSCSICGDVCSPEGRWFLVAENSWEDKLKILEWNEYLVGHDGVHQACSVAHVQELVVHWMVTGSLDFPFAQLRGLGQRLRLRIGKADPKVFDAPPRSIGELAVHRESMQRVLSESPHSLRAILDALLAALRRDSSQSAQAPEPAKSHMQLVPWEV
jgi:hypothetical protein